jgi:hypothetical protein
MRRPAWLHIEAWRKWLLAVFVITDDISYSATDFAAKATASPNRKRIQTLVVIFWGCLLLLVGFSIFLLYGRDTLFNITATTEKVRIAPTPHASYAEWRVDDAVVDPDCAGGNRTRVSGALTIDPRATIEITRSLSKRVEVALSSDNVPSAGYINHDDGDFTELQSCAFVIVPSPQNTALSWLIDGEISVGDTLREGVSPLHLLTSGTVSIADKAVLSGDYYVSDPHILNLGDIFYIQNPTTQGSGLVYITDTPGLQVTYSGKGERGIIQRYKTEAIPIENNIWAKLFNDETLIFLWGSFVVFYPFIKLLIRMSLD